MNNMKYRILISLLLIAFTAKGEGTIYEVPVNVPDVSSYYNIELPQELIGVSLPKGFNDLRLYDSKGTEIPYFVRSESPVQEINQFVSYPLVSNKTNKGVNTLIIENPDEGTIDRFYLIAKKTDVKKSVRIRGSNNRDVWFIVKQQHEIGYTGLREDTQDIIIVDFPKGNYRYYELVLTNEEEAPLDIQRVVKIENSYLYGRFTELPTGGILQKDSVDKRTYLSFPELHQRYKVNKAEFEVDYQSVYLRNGRLQPGRVPFTLRSGSTNTFYFSPWSLNEDSSIVIDNEDSPPLKIESVKLYGLNRYICAFLEAEESYKLVIDHTTYNSSPRYDIEHFRSQIPAILPVLKTGEMETQFIEDIVNTPRDLMWIERPGVLWLIIVVVGIFLIGLCFFVVKELKNKK